MLVHLKWSRLQKGFSSKLQMKRIGPCKILSKYGVNAYKIDLPKEMTLSPIFNVKEIVPSKGPKLTEGVRKSKVEKEVQDINISTPLWGNLMQ